MLHCTILAHQLATISLKHWIWKPIDQEISACCTCSPGRGPTANKAGFVGQLCWMTYRLEHHRRIKLGLGYTTLLSSLQKMNCEDGCVILDGPVVISLVLFSPVGKYLFLFSLGYMDVRGQDELQKRTERDKTKREG